MSENSWWVSRHFEGEGFTSTPAKIWERGRSPPPGSDGPEMLRVSIA